MRKQPAAEREFSTFSGNSAGRLSVLSVSPLEEDQSSLETIIRHSNWALFTAPDLITALTLLRWHEIAVILCERTLLPGTWVDVLERVEGRRNSPSLIVTSRLADERLWAEALNLGAWDVLAKPFDRTEVIRSIASGWEHWYNQMKMQTRTMAAG